MTDLKSLRRALADRYSIDREVGSGGMATVYLARDPKHDRVVAIKVLHVELAQAIGTDRFLREIKIAARLTHPHILPLHDSGKAGPFLYYVMPYVDGESLREKIRREGQLDIEESLRIVRSVASALEYAHGLRVVHRDIKPDNILFNAGEPLVADFGIALAVSAAENDRLTETGLSLGTPAYMSPEQASGESNLDARSDVYSLACMLYEMLAGQPPFVGPNVRAVMARHVTDPVPPLTTVRPAVGEALDRAVRKALAKVPADRFATPKAFSRALDAAETGESFSDAKSIAVVPLVHVGHDAALGLFADGLTEEIIAELSKRGTLQVSSRTSTMQLKGTRKDVRTIGRELNVRYVIEGSVRPARQGMRVTTQLVDAVQDNPLWTEKFSVSPDDADDALEAIGTAVAEAVYSTLGGGRSRRSAPAHGHNAHAYECYLRARNDVWKFTEDAIVHALHYLQEALGIVGEDVLLYAGIAEAYYLFPHVKGNEPESCLEQVRECASRIGELDSDSALGHLYGGLADIKTPGTRESGLASLTRALNAEPDDPAVLLWNSVNAAETGDVERARKCASRLLTVRPRSATSHWSSGWASLMAGDVHDALAAAAAARTLDPENPMLCFLHVYALGCAGRQEDAYTVVEAMLKQHPKNVWTWLGRLYAGAWQQNRRKALRAITPELKQAARWHQTYSLHMAECYSLIGEPAQSLEWLENAVRRGFTNHDFLTSHAQFLDAVSDEERFAALVHPLAAHRELTQTESTSSAGDT